MRARTIPSSGEKLPVIGLGTWQVFDVDSGRAAPLREVLSAFVRLGGRVIDSSPMYGRAEEVVGALAAELKLRQSLFIATKIWTRGKQAGAQSIERSLQRFQTERIDLMQVHNLLDCATHLATMREWKDQGRLRYIGITHYHTGGFAEVERVLRREQLDFLQINYSIAERTAEQRLLPLAQERGVAVVINRPFGGGDLLARVRAKPLPGFAADLGCSSWAQLLLKWILAQPAVTCVIPATHKVAHLEDNVRAGLGPLPDAAIRGRLSETVAPL